MISACLNFKECADVASSLSDQPVEQSEPITPAADAPAQKRKGSVFVGKSHEKDAFVALTENVTGELVPQELYRSASC